MLIRLQDNLFAMGEALEFKESTDGDGNTQQRRMRVRIITPGRSLNDTVYSHKNMEQIRDLLNAGGSRKMYSNHVIVGEKQKVRYPRDMEDWVSTVESAFLPEEGAKGGVQAWAIMRPTEKATELYETAKQVPQEVGVSIDGRATAEKVKDAGDGKPGILIEDIIYLNSADFVTEASAGGRALMEAISENERDDLLELITEIVRKIPVSAIDTPIMEGLNLIAEVLIGNKKIEELFEQDNDDDKVPEFVERFRKKLKTYEKVCEFNEVMYSYFRYLRELVEDREHALVERIKAAQEGVLYVLKEAEKVPFEDIEETFKQFFGEETNPLRTLVEGSEKAVKILLESMEKNPLRALFNDNT